jgi:hypothetical protein
MPRPRRPEGVISEHFGKALFVASGTEGYRRRYGIPGLGELFRVEKERHQAAEFRNHEGRRPVHKELLKQRPGIRLFRCRR